MHLTHFFIAISLFYSLSLQSSQPKLSLFVLQIQTDIVRAIVAKDPFFQHPYYQLYNNSNRTQLQTLKVKKPKDASGLLETAFKNSPKKAVPQQKQKKERDFIDLTQSPTSPPDSPTKIMQEIIEEASSE